MRSRVVVTTSDSPRVESIASGHFDEDADVLIVAPASKISWLDRLTNDEDAARADAKNRAGAAADELPLKVSQALETLNPLQEIEDGESRYAVSSPRDLFASGSNS